jgi:FAD/FMN-containing dehydrogenase
MAALIRRRVSSEEAFMAASYGTPCAYTDAVAFPTTIWATIEQAGDRETAALESFGARYRPAVLGYLHGRGFREPLAEDLCQMVFVRVLAGDVLARADPERGRFRSLLLTVTKRVVQDHLRRRPPEPSRADLDPAGADAAFDHEWTVALAARALEELRRQGSPYYDVLAGHLTGQPQDRNRLWNARCRLAELIRREVAFSCATREQFEEELAYLAPYLRPRNR